MKVMGRKCFLLAMPFVLTLILLSGCASLHQKGVVDSALTVEMLKNTEYFSGWTATGTARLKNGAYRERIIEGSASEIIISLTDKIAFGKLSWEMEAAAVILVTQTGGSGTFSDLAVVINRQGRPEAITSMFLGDRVRVQDISIEDGEIVLHMLTPGPGDPMCCPALEVTRRYELRDGRLVQMPVEN